MSEHANAGKPNERTMDLSVAAAEGHINTVEALLKDGVTPMPKWVRINQRHYMKPRAKATSLS